MFKRSFSRMGAKIRSAARSTLHSSGTGTMPFVLARDTVLSIVLPLMNSCASSLFSSRYSMKTPGHTDSCDKSGSNRNSMRVHRYGARAERACGGVSFNRDMHADTANNMVIVVRKPEPLRAISPTEMTTFQGSNIYRYYVHPSIFVIIVALTAIQ